MTTDLTLTTEQAESFRLGWSRCAQAHKAYHLRTTVLTVDPAEIEDIVARGPLFVGYEMCKAHLRSVGGLQQSDLEDAFSVFGIG